MRSIVLTDTHIDYDRHPETSCRKEQAIHSLDKNVDCVLLCGDNAELAPDLSNHKRFFSTLKEIFNCPIGFIVGNHELWGGSQISCDELLQRTFHKLAEEFNISYLETENLDVCGFSIAGTYGHYDYSLGNERNGVSIQNFLNGMAVIEGIPHQWMDKAYMNWQGRTDQEAADYLIRGFEKRISGHSKLITLSHTAPNKQSIGIPNSPLQDFLGAFSGTLMLENILRRYSPIYHFCGHTHAAARTKIGKTNVFNIGADYNDLSYALVDTDANYAEIFHIKL